MKSILTAGVISVCAAGAAFAQSPTGEWLVEDETAHIRVVKCGDNLWGILSWTKDAPSKDEHNPDPAKRSRSVMGIPILLNMKPSGKRWDGEVYNAEDGRTYTSHVSLKTADVLRIDGCVMGGLICSGEDWKRVPAATKAAETDQAVCSRVANGS